MKKLISAQIVKQAKADGKKEITAPAKSTMITAEARDLAGKYGIRFVESARPEEVKTTDIDPETLQLIIREVLNKLPAEKRDPALVTDAVMRVLSGYGK